MVRGSWHAALECPRRLQLKQAPGRGSNWSRGTGRRPPNNIPLVGHSRRSGNRSGERAGAVSLDRPNRWKIVDHSVRCRPLSSALSSRCRTRDGQGIGRLAVVVAPWLGLQEVVVTPMVGLLTGAVAWVCPWSADEPPSAAAGGGCASSSPSILRGLNFTHRPFRPGN